MTTAEALKIMEGKGRELGGLPLLETLEQCQADRGLMDAQEEVAYLVTMKGFRAMFAPV